METLGEQNAELRRENERLKMELQRREGAGAVLGVGGAPPTKLDLLRRIVGLERRVKRLLEERTSAVDSSSLKAGLLHTFELLLRFKNDVFSAETAQSRESAGLSEACSSPRTDSTAHTARLEPFSAQHSRKGSLLSYTTRAHTDDGGHCSLLARESLFDLKLDNLRRLIARL